MFLKQIKYFLGVTRSQPDRQFHEVYLIFYLQELCMMTMVLLINQYKASKKAEHDFGKASMSKLFRKCEAKNCRCATYSNDKWLHLKSDSLNNLLLMKKAMY